MESSNNSYALLQLKRTEENAVLRFMSYRWTMENRGEIDLNDYETVYTGAISKEGDSKDILEHLFDMFNRYRPSDYTGRSISVSDVVILRRNGQAEAWFCDSIGFQRIEMEEKVS